MIGYRSNDAVLTICQNNVAKSIEIIGMNEQAAVLIGYGVKELNGRALASIIPMRLATLLIEYVEYRQDANDAGEVLSKVQNFSLLTKEKKEKSFRMKVVRDNSTRDRLMFRLVLQDAMDIRKDSALYTLIQENFKGHEVLHPVLRVPNLASLEKDISITEHYHHKAGLRASLVLVQPDYMDDFERRYGPAQCRAMMRHMIGICNTNLRPGDLIAATGDRQLGVILFDAVADSARMVANRLRWQIAAQPFILADNSPLTMTASIVYATIDGSKSPHELVTACNEQLLAKSDATGSQLLAVGF